MAIYKHSQSVLTLSGYELSAFDESADSISIAPVGDEGAYTIGASGRGVFVATGNESGVLTVKLLQHSRDNKFLSEQFAAQRNNLKNFVPIEMYFKDTLNGDEFIGTRGFFTTPPTFARGTAHNIMTWVISFEKAQFKLEQGLYN
jgi:hypothetical protein